MNLPLLRVTGVRHWLEENRRFALLASRDNPQPLAQRGFTLIELITVMIVIGILAVVALPKFSLLQGFNDVGYRNKVMAAIEYARKAAVAQRRNTRVTIASSAVTLEVEKATPEGDSGTPGSYVALVLPGSSSNQFSPPAGVTLTPASSTFTFSALGKASAAQSFTLSGGAGSITVESETGYVH